jgi:orotate phosphoribosyltransferase-like protein
MGTLIRKKVELRKEGMTYRQIAKEALISPRDIKLILEKYRLNGISGLRIMTRIC